MFCSKCGKNVPDNAKFCDHCGAQQFAANQSNSCTEAGQQEQKAVKKSKKKVIGIVLLCLQAVSILGVVANGELTNLTDYFTGGASGIFQLLGFFLPAIVGVALLVLDYLKKRK